MIEINIEVNKLILILAPQILPFLLLRTVVDDSLLLLTMRMTVLRCFC